MITDPDNWLPRLSKQMALVDTWFKRVQINPTVSESSSLAEDNRRFPQLLLQSNVWNSLAVSVEHEHMFFQCLHATKSTFPGSYLTVLRTALMSASHAVWVLAPKNRIARLQRAFKVRLDDLNSEIATLNAWAAAAETEIAELKREDLKRLTGLRVELSQIATELDLDLEVPKWRLQHTGIIQSATKDVFPRDPEKVGQVEFVWRTASSAAHGQRYFASSRFETSSSGEGIISGKLQDIGTAATAAVLVTSRAWELFDMRIG